LHDGGVDAKAIRMAREMGLNPRKSSATSRRYEANGGRRRRASGSAISTQRGSAGPAQDERDIVAEGLTVPESEKARRRAARERVSAYYDEELATLIGHVEDAIRRYRDGEIDVHDVDEIIHRYSKAARKLWVFCWSGGGGSSVELVAGVLDRSGEDAGSSWWNQAAPSRRSPDNEEDEG